MSALRALTQAPPVRVQDPVQRTMQLSILEGSVTQVFLNWTTGSVLIGYMLHYGATPTQIGLISSVPLLAQTMSPFAAWLASLAGRRKVLTALLAALGRGLWLLAALLPQLGASPAAMPALLVGLVMVSSLFQAGAGTLWTSWMGDVVPDERRGRYFGRRAGIVGLIGMLANLAAGWFLDRMGAPLGFQVVLLVAVLCAALGVYLYTFHYEPPATPGRFGLRETFRLPLRDRNFRRFLAFAFYWQMAVLIGAPFVIPYFLEELRMSFTQIALWSAIASSCALITTSQWGRVADRVGNRAVLAIGTCMAGAALPLFWILAGLTGKLGFIWLSAVFDAVAWGAIGPAIFNLALSSAPKANRVAFIAMYSLAAGAAGFLGGLLSGPLLTLFMPFEFDIWGMQWTGFHTLFLVSGLARSQAWRLLRRVEETRAWRTRELLRAMRPWRALGFPWRH